jgi:hypothetical protein
MIIRPAAELTPDPDYAPISGLRTHIRVAHPGPGVVPPGYKQATPNGVD